MNRKNFSWTIAFGMMLLISLSSYATTYYVDGNNGNNNNDGTTVATAWKTISKVNGHSFSPGDTILFKRGCLWREMLSPNSSGSESDPIVFGSYGEGERPIITGQRVYTAGWALQSDNIWKSNSTMAMPWRLLQNGTELLLAKTLEEIDGTQYFWYHDGGSVYLYSETDPNNTTIEVNLVENGSFFSSVHHLVIRDIEFQGGSYRSVGIAGNSSYLLIVNCVAGAYSNMGITGSSFHHITIDSTLVDSHFEFDYDVSSQRGPHDGLGWWGNIHDCEIKNSTIRNWGHTGITFESAVGPIEYNRVHHCLLEAPGIPYGRPTETDGSTSQYNEFYDNIMRDFTVRNQVGGHDNIWHHNLIYNFSNSKIKDYGTAQAFSLQGIESDANYNIMEYNTIVDMDEPALQYFGGWKNIVGNIFRNNIILNTGKNSKYSENKGLGIVLPGSNTIDTQKIYNNCIYNPGYNKTISYQGYKLTVDEFNAKNGQTKDSIANNISTDPLLTDISNLDFHLRDSSFCINAGVMVSTSSFDFDGNPIPYSLRPDIGAYEFIGQIPLIVSYSYVISSCAYEVTFSGHALSDNVPGWYWNFGDGNESAEQNPVHRYDTAGVYPVQLIVTDGGNTDTCYHEITLGTIVEMPVATGMEHCGPGILELKAEGGSGDTFKWYDAATGGNYLGLGSTFETPFLSSSKTYFVASVIPGDTNIYHGAKYDTSGTGGFYEWDDAEAIRGLIFDVTQPVQIRSVKVYNQPGQAAIRTISIVDNEGNEVASKEIFIPEGESRIELNFNIQPGSSYFIKAADSHKGLYRNFTGIDYPYQIGDAITIITSDLGPDNYYFFYDWEVLAISDVSSCRTSVDATIIPFPHSEFDYTVNGDRIEFENKSIGNLFLWDFGDGNTSEEVAPSHSYPDNEQYLVKLSASNSCGADTSEKVVSLADTVPPVGKPFLDYEFIGDGYGFVSTLPSEEPWVPDVVINESKIIWISPDGGGDGSSESSPTTIESAVNSAGEDYTIIALDGEYSFEIYLTNLIHVNLISKNKYGAVIHPLGENSDDAAFRFTNNCKVKYVNFIGFDVAGGRSFIFNGGAAITAEAHHIYFSDMKFHDLFLAIYSGLHSHDWTIDRCLHYDSRFSYLWYMMGFHQTVMNSIMYNNTYLSLAIRGHYPLDEFYNWQGGNPFVKDRDHPYLAPDDWTHKIINNTFGTTYDMSRPHRGQLGLFYNILPEEEAEGKGEACYLPPQNVVVANNIFYDKGPQKKVGFDVWASRGINNGKIDGVNGILVTNNVTANYTLVVPGDGTDVSGIKNDEGNTIKSKTIDFVDESLRDYHLKASSVDLIDKGTKEVYIPNNDFAGKERKGNPDVGAYEYDENSNAVKEEGSLNNKLDLFPNPTNGRFYINLPDGAKKYSLSVFNGMMQQVMEVKLNNREMVNISHLQEGVYYCVVSSENKRYASGKVVLMK